MVDVRGSGKATCYLTLQRSGQLDRLLTLMSLPNVSLGIIPMMTPRTAVGSTGFWVFDSTFAALETPTASIEVTRPQEVRLYSRMFETLQSSAVYGQPARALITRTLSELSG
jgi:hypothetical protein